MLTLTKYAFVGAPMFNASIFTLFSSVFDAGNDLIFVALLYNESRTSLFAIAAALFCSTIAFNAWMCAFVLWRERKNHTRFAQWQQSAFTYAAVVSFLALANCDALAVVATGRTYEARKRGNADSPGVAKLFRAPVSAEFERHLKLASWWGLICDDVCFIAIQVVRTIAARCLAQRYIVLHNSLSMFGSCGSSYTNGLCSAMSPLAH